jgi:ribosomal protein S10
MLILKIKIISPNLHLLNFYEKLLIFFLKKKNVNVSRVKLSERFKNFVLLRSPHVYKKSKEHFTLYNKNRVLIVKSSDASIFSFLSKVISRIKKVKIVLNYKEE